MNGRRGPDRRHIRLGIVVAAVAVTLAAHGAMETESGATSGKLFVPEPAQASLFSLGFDPVIADYYWVHALQIVGGTRGPVEDHASLIGDLIDVVIELDPWVDHPYRFAAVWLTDGVDSVRRANRILEQGIAYHPTDWRNRLLPRIQRVLLPRGQPPRGGDPRARHLAAGRPPLSRRLRDAAARRGRQPRHGRTLPPTADPDHLGRVRARRLPEGLRRDRDRATRPLPRSARVEFWERHGRDIRAPAELWEGDRRVIDRVPRLIPTSRASSGSSTRRPARSSRRSTATAISCTSTRPTPPAASSGGRSCDSAHCADRSRADRSRRHDRIE